MGASLSFHVSLYRNVGCLSYTKVFRIVSQYSSFRWLIVCIPRTFRPWDSMVEFDDKIPQRDFDNFQFVNFTEFKAKGRGHSAAFALAALMEVPGL
jgi:E3 ubiquitin-protein ligase RGLG